MKEITLLLFFSIFAYSFGQTSIANYDVSITTIWNTTDHTTLPPNAHWSPLIGATHKNLNDVLEFGVLAPSTNGIKTIAETGNTSDFQSEVNNNANANLIPQKSFLPFAGNNSIASISGLEVTTEFHYVTLVSMVAPSPDWFIAVNNLDLKSGNPSINNGWKDTFTMDIFAYDSGTDSGTNYTSANMVTVPRIPIAKVSGFPINGNKMATIMFTYNSSTLSTGHINSIENLKIYPNPSNGEVTISNIKGIDLENVKVYNVLGKLVKQIKVKKKSPKLNLDLSQLNKGIYLLKTSNTEDSSNIQKLIIN